MRIVIGKDVKAKAGIDYIRSLLKEHDTEDLQWVRFDLGPIRNGAGSRCLVPGSGLGYRIACQFPKAFPLSLRISKPPIYRNSDGSWPGGIDPPPHTVFTNEETRVQWIRQHSMQELEDQDEAAVWTFGNAAYKWLRHSRQIEGRDNEIEADAYAATMLKRFSRECKQTV
jgi:hypothetical protein